MEIEKIKDILVPNYESRKKRIQTFKDISIYLIIALIAIIVSFVVPLLSGCLKGDIGMNFPTTAEGWILYLSINGGTTAGNVALFILFKQQAKINCKNDPNYLKANEILKKHREEKEFIPRSPKSMNKQEYISKLTCIIIFSMMSFITISSLVISFDLITFISCVLSTVVSLIFGWVTMLKNEDYWTGEYLEYALWIDKRTHKDVEEPQGEQNNA